PPVGNRSILSRVEQIDKLALGQILDACKLLVVEIETSSTLEQGMQPWVAVTGRRYLRFAIGAETITHGADARHATRNLADRGARRCIGHSAAQLERAGIFSDVDPGVGRGGMLVERALDPFASF